MTCHVMLITRPDRQFLTRQEIVDGLGVGLRTVDTWLAEGRLPYIKLGRRVLIDVRDFEAFIRDHKKNEARAGNADPVKIGDGAADDVAQP